MQCLRWLGRGSGPRWPPILAWLYIENSHSQLLSLRGSKIRNFQLAIASIEGVRHQVKGGRPRAAALTYLSLCDPVTTRRLHKKIDGKGEWGFKALKQMVKVFIV